jgi:uncharacterized coiled-coil protein SlyX
MAESGKAESGKESARRSAGGITSCLRGRLFFAPGSSPPRPTKRAPCNLSTAVKSPELSGLYVKQVQPMLGLLRRMEQVYREENRVGCHEYALEEREKNLARAEERRDSSGLGTKKHAAIEGRLPKLEHKIALQEHKLEKAQEALAAARDALSAVQAKQALTSLFDPVKIPKTKVRAQ